MLYEVISLRGSFDIAGIVVHLQSGASLPAVLVLLLHGIVADRMQTIICSKVIDSKAICNV